MKESKFILLILFIFPLVLFAQKSKTQLQKEKQQSLEKIKEVEKILIETSSQKKNTVGELNALNHRIKEQETLISGIKSEISLLNKEIADTQEIIDALEDDLKNLKNEYAGMLFSVQKASGSVNKLIFLFSSPTFDHFMMRLRYMEQYGEMRKLQVEQIQKVQAALVEEIKVIEQRRAEQNKLLAEQTKEINSLAELKIRQHQLVKNLEKQESKLRKDLEDTRKAVARLDKMIEDIVKEEIERAARAAKASGTSAEAIALSNSFAENKNKLPWPVNGFISQGFGRHNHPVFKGVIMESNGINIQTKQEEKVRSVFEGEVTRVAVTPNLGKTIIIKHGDYFTVYAGLKDIFVKVGQKVTTNQELGTVVANKEGISELQFQIRKSTTALDPVAWLRKT